VIKYSSGGSPLVVFALIYFNMRIRPFSKNLVFAIFAISSG